MMHPMAGGMCEGSGVAINRLRLIDPSRARFDCWPTAERLLDANHSNLQVTEGSPLRLYQLYFYDYYSAEMHRLAPVIEFFTP